MNCMATNGKKRGLKNETCGNGKQIEMTAMEKSAAQR